MGSVFGYAGLIEAIFAGLGRGRRVQIAGASKSVTELVLAGVIRAKESGRFDPIVVVTPNSKEIGPWLSFFTNLQPNLSLAGVKCRTAVLPYFSSYGNDRFINHNLSRRQRLYALAQLGDSSSPLIVLTTLQALAQTTEIRSSLDAAVLNLKVGLEIDQDRLINHLEDLGYLVSSSVTEEGAYAVRGGIVDIFPVNMDSPLRLEFVGDLITSLRLFDPSDQKSRQVVDAAFVYPAYETLTPAASRENQTQNLFDLLLEQEVAPSDRDGIVHQFQQGLKFSGFDMLAPVLRSQSVATISTLPADSTLFFPQSVASCVEAFETFYQAVTAHYHNDIAKKLPHVHPRVHFSEPKAISAGLENVAKLVEWGNPYATDTAEFLRLEARFVYPNAPVVKSQGAELFDKWIEVFREVLSDDQGVVVLLAQHEDQRERIANLLDHRGFRPTHSAGVFAQLAEGRKLEHGVYVGSGSLSSHLWLEDQACLVIPEQILFGTPPRKQKTSSQKLQNYLSSFADLKVNDLVVHVQHGIGKYAGLTTLTVAGLSNDFLVIEYAGGDKIYLPVDRLSLLQRYTSGGELGADHAIDKLGGLGWEKRKARVKGAIKDMAEKLLKLQAQRSLTSTKPYLSPDDEYLKFEAEFPFEETVDQLRAIQDVEADLMGGKPMDRLVCGDVGFGKTEVALRAAMRTVLEGSQVLVLVPTTVLCYQHYRLFKMRLEPHGIKVAQVNRFVPPSAIRDAAQGLEAGSVDILIGTHRLLSRDIKPKKLGLLVIDEEQRFGVTHKEKLKEIRAGAHVLTLTATPIPRTLHMAMVGMRDISIIATPPQDRMSVKTFVARFDEHLIKEAIEHEIRRGGQVFFVHNRVEDIEAIRIFIKSLVPGADVRIGHGQMPEHQLERVILDFIEQRFQVLLCTTIIESGIDMPNVNTLIVNHADRFGLAQLYQLRGRVGRSNQQAYAYFLTGSEERLSDDARKRLEVLAAHQELGAGFQIASYDLELRGAGNLLGGEQSGHAAAVGLELYTEMLDDAIHAIRGEVVSERIDTEIKLPVAALIPPEYVQTESLRLQLYKKLFAANNDEDLRTLKQEMEDRFGQLPGPAALLFKVAKLKQQLRSIGATRLSASKGVCEIRFSALPDSTIDRILVTISRQPGRYKLAPDNRLLVYMDFPSTPSPAEQDRLIADLTRAIAPFVDSATR